MPFFEQNPLTKLTLQPGAADHELDLRGIPRAAALQLVEHLLAAPEPAASYLIRFDPAANDGRETLFLPIGRRLLQARRDGQIAQCLPAADGAGYFVAFSGSA